VASTGIFAFATYFLTNLCIDLGVSLAFSSSNTISFFLIFLIKRGLYESSRAFKYLSINSQAREDKKTILDFPPFPIMLNSLVSKFIFSRFNETNSDTRSPVEKNNSKSCENFDPENYKSWCNVK
jgi:hypothetical protein